MDYESIKKTVDSGQYANLTQGQKDIFNKTSTPSSTNGVMYKATDASGSNVLVGNKDINPQFKYTGGTVGSNPPPPAPGTTGTPTTTPDNRVLTPTQVGQYYKEETNKTDPLSPLNWLSRQGTASTGTQNGTTGTGDTSTLTGGSMLNGGTDGASTGDGSMSSPYYSRTGAGTLAQPKVESEEEIGARKRTQAQAEIDALNKYYDSLLEEQNVANQKSMRSTNAISSLTGLAGSSEADLMSDETTAKALKANKAINNERNVAIQSILSNIRGKATEEARTQRLDAAKSIEDSIRIRNEIQEEAVRDLQNLAAGGVTFDGLKNSDPASFNALAETFGGADALKGAFVKNIPQEQIIDKRVENGKYIIARLNPITGKTSIETTDLGIPNGYSKSVDLGNQIMFVPDNFDPNNKNGAQPYYVPKGLSPAQASKTSSTGSEPGTYGSDLDAIIGRVPLIIPSENGKIAFSQAVKSARDDADRIAIVATTVLRNSPATVREDFANQSIAVRNLDKAIAVIDQGTQTGLLNNAAQYTYNLAGKDFDPKIAAINSYLTSAIQPYRNSITGAAWGTQEDGEYKQLFGSTKYSPTELRERLVRIKEIMKDKSASALNAQINPIDGGYNPFTQTGAKRTIDDYRQEFPQANDEELTALMQEEGY